MDVKQYTDEKYIPINDLSSFGDKFINQTKEYRQNFMEIIPLSDFEFANIVETPKLVKKRYEKNVEIKGRLEIDAKHHDYILALALKIIKGESMEIIDKETRKNIINKFKENMFDLTIVTNWLVDNVDNLIKDTSLENISYEIPELNHNDIKFINKYNKKNEHYSINDYIKLNTSSYETGRKALERMSELKLYIKTKLGKKFVYKPTQKLLEIMKGGEYGN